jgi:hypothetical protein
VETEIINTATHAQFTTPLLHTRPHANELAAVDEVADAISGRPRFWGLVRSQVLTAVNCEA